MLGLTKHARPRNQVIKPVLNTSWPDTEIVMLADRNVFSIYNFTRKVITVIFQLSVQCSFNKP